MRTPSFKRARSRRHHRRHLRRQQSRRIHPTGETGWRQTFQTAGGAAGAMAGFIELFLLILL
jgi:hypothetical protein